MTCAKCHTEDLELTVECTTYWECGVDGRIRTYCLKCDPYKKKKGGKGE